MANDTGKVLVKNESYSIEALPDSALMRMERRSYYDPRDRTWTLPLPATPYWIKYYTSKGFRLSPPEKVKKPRKSNKIGGR